MSKKQFLFCNTSKRRDKAQSLHDLLISAKDGLKKTRLMYGANLGHDSMMVLLEFAKAKGLIEEVELPQPKHWKQKSIFGWKTTAKGLEYAKNVYDYSKLLLEIEGK